MLTKYALHGDIFVFMCVSVNVSVFMRASVWIHTCVLYFLFICEDFVSLIISDWVNVLLSIYYEYVKQIKNSKNKKKLFTRKYSKYMWIINKEKGE